MEPEKTSALRAIQAAPPETDRRAGSRPRPLATIRRALWIMLGIVVFFASFCFAGADVSVDLRLDRTEATLEDSVALVVGVSGARGTDGRPVLNGVDAFDVSAGGTSSRVEIVNGQVNAGIDYTYTLQPKRVGTFVVGPAEVTVNGKTFRSDTASLTISEPSRAGGTERGPLFLEAGLSKNKAFVGEQIVYTLKLYTQLQVSDLSLNLPSADGLSFKQLGKPVEYQGSYNGRAYRILEVRYALMPSEAGHYGIPPSRLQLTIYGSRRRSPRSFFDDPFFSFSQGEQKSIASDARNLSVRELPKEGMPAGFSGLVGDFRIEAGLSPEQVKSGESATLTVEVAGRGDVKRIPDLQIAEQGHLKVYADQPVLNEAVDAKGFSGTKTMKWALVPEAAGRYPIPPLAVTFFDPEAAQYRTVKTPDLSLSVLPGTEPAVEASDAPAGGQASPEPAKKAVEEIGRDILPIHSALGDLRSGSRMRAKGILFWSALIAPLLIYGSAWCGRKLRNKTAASEAAARARKAAAALSHKWRRGGELNCIQMSLAVRDYLNDRFGLSLGALTPGEAAKVLRASGVSETAAADLEARLRQMEDRIYTGRGEQVCQPGEDLRKLIRRIEREAR